MGPLPCMNGLSPFHSPFAPLYFMTLSSFIKTLSIGNRMNASAFRDLWARVMF